MFPESLREAWPWGIVRSWWSGLKNWERPCSQTSLQNDNGPAALNQRRQRSDVHELWGSLLDLAGYRRVRKTRKFAHEPSDRKESKKEAPLRLDKRQFRSKNLHTNFAAVSIARLSHQELQGKESVTQAWLKRNLMCWRPFPHKKHLVTRLQPRKLARVRWETTLLERGQTGASKLQFSCRRKILSNQE